MISKNNKVTAFKLAIKIVFFGGLAGLFLYSFLTFKRPDQNTVIDKTITYTTTELETFTTPLNFTPSPEDVVDSIPKYVTVPQGGLDWKLFAKTKSIPYNFTDDEGQELQGIKPEFPANLKKFDGQEITIQGYMFPLNSAEGQSMFLFGPFPVSCPFHYHVGPALVIEAHAKDNIEFKYEPITLKGKLELIPRDDDYTVFYRLQDARIIK